MGLPDLLFGDISQQVAFPWLIDNLKIFAMLFVASVVIREVRQVWMIFSLTAGALIYIVHGSTSPTFRLGGSSSISAALEGSTTTVPARLAMGVPLAIYAWGGVQEAGPLGVFSPGFPCSFTPS